MSDPVSVVRALLEAVERRDRERLASLYHPAIAFHWPPGLPYGGRFEGGGIAVMSRLFAAVWEPLQPTAELRRMDAELVATGEGGEVVVRYWWKGESPRAGRFAAETLAEYRVREGGVARAQMFHFDLAGLIGFLARAGVEAAQGERP